MSSRFSDGERIAPPDSSTRSGDTSIDRPSSLLSASSIGRANASPTMTMKFARSRSTRRHSASASRWCSAGMITEPPVKSVLKAIQCAVPCMKGQAGTHRERGLRAPFGDHLRRADRLAAAARAAERTEEDVFVAPHDALRHAGGAARVEDVEVVGGARPE
jgi:hypothetical protein